MMAKAVLVLDKMPMDCEDCNFSYRNAYSGVRCSALEKPIGDSWISVANGERSKLCPLKELPEYHDHEGFVVSKHPDFMDGWDACLKEITEDWE